MGLLINLYIKNKGKLSQNGYQISIFEVESLFEAGRLILEVIQD